MQPVQSVALAPAPDPGRLILPRLWTPPLRELTPATSYGFDEIAFGEDVLGVHGDPWQDWLSIHAGELLPDGRPRFRTLLILIARQNGKSFWARRRLLYWMFVDLHDMPIGSEPFIIGTSTDRQYAKKFWSQTVTRIRRNDWLRPELENIRLTIGEECVTLKSGVEYGFAANNASAGRSRTVHKALVDEIREHHTLDAWGAIDGAMTAAGANAEFLGISNEGDDTAVLLDTLYKPAVAFIETGDGDDRLGLMAWSSPDGADPTDMAALDQANPSHRVDRDALLAKARRALAAGGEELASFRTEHMCQRVRLLDPAIDPGAWANQGRATIPDLADHRQLVGLVLDVAIDESHASLVSAATIDGVTYVDAVDAWDDMAVMRREVIKHVRRVRPRRFGWLPNGPAAAYAADFIDRKRKGWPPRGTELHPITSETAAVCMALPGLVAAGLVVHGRDPMLDAHVERAQKVKRADTWVYGRRGVGPVDGVYALAGAVHLARTMPPARPPLAVV